jgi:peroxiredoxin
MNYRTIRSFILVCMALIGLTTIAWFFKAYKLPPNFKEDKIILKNEAGEPVRISDFKGQYVLVSYFQTWCGDCIGELEDIDALQTKVGKDKLKVIMVSDEPWKKIIHFKEKHCPTLDYYQSVEALHSQGIRVFPTTYLLDKNGHELISKIQAYDWSSEEVLNKIN